MRSLPRKLSSDAQLYTAALEALARRAYSVHEMRVHLERRAPDPDAVRRVLDRLKAEKLLDDVSYARQFVRTRARTRLHGRFRIARDLRTRGIPDGLIDSALDAMEAETDEGKTVRTLLARRMKTLRGPLDIRRTASLYRSLLRAGFPAEIVRRELRAMAKGSADDLPEISTE
jgi:regulatory protein